MMRTSLVCLLAVLLAACESVAVIPEVADVERARVLHTRQIDSLASWTLEGRISIRFEDEAWHAGLFWHQIKDIYQIRLIAPFGQGGAQLDGSAHGVVLNNGEGEFHADSADQLLADQFGWRIPVDGLRYWATGLPAPTPAHVAQYDASGRLLELQQGDWQVEYRGYVQADGLSLPAKIFLKHSTGLDVRLVVDNWTTRRQQVAGE